MDGFDLFDALESPKEEYEEEEYPGYYVRSAFEEFSTHSRLERTHSHLEDDCARIMIFLLIGLCVGTPTVAWTLRLLLLHVRRGGRVSIFIIFLLLNVILELFLIPFIVVVIVSSYLHSDIWFYDYTPLMAVLIGLRLCGLCFHQLVALESVLSLRHPQCFSCFSSSFCSIPICLTVCICNVTSLIDPFALMIIVFILFAVAVLAAAFSCVINIKASCLCANSRDTSLTNRRTRLHILVVAMGTLWLLYAPLISWICVELGGWRPSTYIGSMTACLMTFRVVTDPLLCVLVFREEISHRESTQTGIELNAVPASE